ncbi:DNA double-strand break repair rad50 ATPase [Methanobacterium formicicum DSM 3637]|uniref:DNA double-strand break repair Rad50 ATPase n=2 Tax=Methanobacterium formicicum TaxID=2162 RepID=K2RU18_METFP|nr:DNA double-strand break repair rad50 ATPase [Methanobacterium formicicum DSM 3637]
MIIESLHISNFKSHRDTRIEFDTGISIIIGGNGAGKSSILEAVSFALFKQHTSKRIEQLITIGQKRMSVEIQFTANGRTYRVLRERTKTSSKAIMKIKEGGRFQSLVSGDKQVTLEVQNLLEMDGDLFLNAVYVRQGEIADLIDKTSSEKKQMIGRLLGIDSLEKAWKNLKVILDKYNERNIRLEGKIESFEDFETEFTVKKDRKRALALKIKDINLKRDENIIESDLLQEKKEILDKRSMEFENANTLLKSKKDFQDQLEKSRKDLEGQLNEIILKEEEITRIEPRLKKLNVLKSLAEKSKELKVLQKDKKGIITILNDIERFEKVLNENEQFYNEYSELDSEINNLQYAKDQFEGSRMLIQQYTERKSKIEGKMKQSLKKIRDVLEKSNQVLGTSFASVEEFENHLSTFKPQLEAQIREASDSIQDIKRELSNLQVKNENLEKPINELEQVKDQCPICKSDITPQKREELLTDYQSEIEDNQEISGTLKVRLDELESKKRILDSQQSNIQSINLGILKEYLKSGNDHQQEIDNINSSLQELQKKIVILENIEKDIQNNRSKLAAIKGNYEKYLTALGSLESLGDYEEHRARLDEINAAIRDLKKNISALMEIAGDSVEDLPGEIAYLEQLSREHQHLLGQVSQKESLIQRIDENQRQIREINEELDQIQKVIDDLNYNEEAHERVKNEWKLKNEELMELSGQKQLLVGQLDQLSNSIQEIEQKLDSLKKYEKELKNLKDFLKLLNIIRDLYGKDGVQKDLRNISRPLIEEKTRELFERFNFEYSDVRLDEDYDVTIYGPSGESSLDMISGGEKIAVALALRLGITQVLSGGNLEMIMLDEPTIHLDAYRRQELIDLLKKMSIIPQMIIVTHDVDLEDAADNIMKIEKEDGVSFLVES